LGPLPTRLVTLCRLHYPHINHLHTIPSNVRGFFPIRESNHTCILSFCISLSKFRRSLYSTFLSPIAALGNRIVCLVVKPAPNVLQTETLRPGLASDLVSCFLITFCTHFLSPHARYLFHHFILLIMYSKIQIIGPFIMQFCPPSCHFIPLGCKYSSEHTVLKKPLFHHVYGVRICL
jgi:hypothetical protein